MYIHSSSRTIIHTILLHKDNDGTTTTGIRSGRLRLYGRTCDEDWVKKCMEYRVEGRGPVGRLRRTWLESVDADMAELEIDKDDVHDRKKWRRDVMKRKSNPIRKRTINR